MTLQEVREFMKGTFLLDDPTWVAVTNNGEKDMALIGSDGDNSSPGESYTERTGYFHSYFNDDKSDWEGVSYALFELE